MSEPHAEKQTSSPPTAAAAATPPCGAEEAGHQRDGGALGSIAEDLAKRLALAEHTRRLLVDDAERQAERDREERQERERILARCVEVAAEEDRRFSAQPCAAAMREERPAIGADACVAAAAADSCPFFDGPRCAFPAERARYELVEERLRSGRVQALEREILLRAEPGRREKGERVPKIQLRETDAVRAVRMFLSRRAGVLTIAKDSRPFRGDETCLVLAGGVGCGKTLAATFAIGRSGTGGLYVAASELEDPHFARWKDVRATGLLVLDDAGTEYAGEKGFAPARIMTLLVHRHGAKLRTIVTTNLLRRGADQLGFSFVDRYGDRVDDRLKGWGIYVSLPGGSLRGS